MLPSTWCLLMEEREETRNENEDNLEMEVELTGTDGDNVDNDGNAPQNSTFPSGGAEVRSQVRSADFQNDGRETVSGRSPQNFDDDHLGGHSGNDVPATRDFNDESSSKKSRLNFDSEEEGSTCPICFDNWTNLGEHRICSLRCGHLFGMSCIKRWLNSEAKKQCPTCKKRVNLKSDIRFIYAKKLIAVDTSEVEEIKKRLDATTEERNRMQVELTKCLCRERLLVQELDDFKKKVQQLTVKLEVKEQYGSSQKVMSATQRSSNSLRCYMDKSLELSKDGGCRVLDHKSDLDLIVVSMKSSNNFYSGYGVRKISLSSYKPTAFIGLHTGQIRDIKFHAQNPWLLSVSLDKSVKVLDVNSNAPVTSLTRDCPLWSCCWDGDNPHSFFIGEQQGTVLKYDMRQITEPIATLFVPGDMSPVVSLAAIEQDPCSAIAHGGIISCKLSSLWIFENTPNEYTRFHFPVEGPFVSMTYQNSTKQMLVSSRPNTRTSFARHVVCNISKDGEDLRCDTVHCFPGGPTQKMLFRSCFLSNGSDFIAAYHETQRCVCIWNINTGKKACSIPAHDPVLDLCGVQTDSANILLNLTEKKLEFFKFADQ